MRGAVLTLSPWVKDLGDDLPQPHFEAEFLETIRSPDDFDGYFDGPTETRTLSWAEFQQRMLQSEPDDDEDGGAA